MPSLCAIASCHNGEKEKLQRGKDLIFHCFPINNKNICKLWESKCKRGDEIKIKNARICSDHFAPEAYERDLKSELLNLPPKKILKKDAVPSIFNQNGSNEINTNTKRQTAVRYEKRKQKQLVQQLLMEHDKKLNNNQENKDELLQEALTKLKICEAKLLEEQNRNQIQSQLICNLQSTVNRQRQKLIQTQTKEKKIGQNTSASSFIKEIENAKKSKTPNYKTEDIVKALSIKSISTKAYELTRKTSNEPMPTVRTLQNWVKKFSCKEGILFDVLDILKEKLETIEITTKLSVLSFDEVGLDSSVAYDPCQDRIYQKSKAQVMMMRGLYDDWKSPIYFDFNTNITKELLFTIIMEIEKRGIIVCAMVCDLGPENQSLMKKLDYREGNVKFKNPFDQSRHVFVLADVPHCLKNIRNHLIDDGVIIYNQNTNQNDNNQHATATTTTIDYSTLKQLVINNKGDQTLHSELSMSHITLKQAERMRVKPAAQLLSHRTSLLASQVFPQIPEIAEFFEILNNGFDLLNSRNSAPQENIYKSAFGLEYEKQKEALLKLRNLLYTMRFKTKKLGKAKSELLPSQRGFVLAIDAVLLLFEELKSLYGVTYLMTSKLTQDIVESLFSLIRSLGGPNTNPDPPTFRIRLRMILLGSRFKAPVGSNIQIEDTDISYVSSELIRKTQIQQSVEDNVADETIGQNDNNTDEDEEEVNTQDECLTGLAASLDARMKQGGKNKTDQNLLNEKRSSAANLNIRDKDRSSNKIIDPNRSFFHLGKNEPDESTLEKVKLCNSVFTNAFWRFKNQSNISKKIFRKINEAYPDMNKQFIEEFIRIRIRMKVKYLKQQQKEEKMNKRNAKKSKQFVKSSTTSTK